MHTFTDWIALWRELAERRAWKWKDGDPQQNDHWRSRAQDFETAVRARWEKPDSSRTFLLSQLTPESTLLDIGAGTGAWAILIAQSICGVTALAPSPAMLARLRANIAASGQTNITVADGSWPESEVETHDFSLCAHAMYGVPDFPTFIQRMNAVTRRTCFMILRAPPPGNLMAEASQYIYGHPYDSPNLTVAYNALLQMCIYPNVLMEQPSDWHSWESYTFEEALAHTKNRLGLSETNEYDSYLTSLLRQRLREQNGRYQFPPLMRSGMLWWNL